MEKQAQQCPREAPMTEFSRRVLLTGAGGITAATALGTAAQALPSTPVAFSATFLEYRRCRQAHLDACDVPEPDFGTAEADAWDANTTSAVEARHQTSIVIRDRPIRSQQDFAELALVVRDELYCTEPDGMWHAHSTNDELSDALMRAVLTMIDGGANV